MFFMFVFYVVFILVLIVHFYIYYKKIKQKKIENYVNDIDLVTIFESKSNPNFGSIRIGDFQFAWGSYDGG